MIEYATDIQCLRSWEYAVQGIWYHESLDEEINYSIRYTKVMKEHYQDSF